MLKAVCAVVVGAALAAGAAAFASTRIDYPGADSASVAVAPARAGARPVVMTVSLRTELRCGQLLGGGISLRLPAQVHMPGSVSAAAVLFGTRPASQVRVTGHALAIDPPRPSGVMCNSIRVGVAKIVFTADANLGNPQKPGKYPLAVVHAGQWLATMLIVH